MAAGIRATLASPSSLALATTVGLGLGLPDPGTANPPTGFLACGLLPAGLGRRLLDGHLPGGLDALEAEVMLRLILVELRMV